MFRDYSEIYRETDKFIVELHNFIFLKSVEKALDLLIAPSKYNDKKY